MNNYTDNSVLSEEFQTKFKNNLIMNHNFQTSNRRRDFLTCALEDDEPRND